MDLQKVTVFCFFASYAVALLMEVAQFVRRSSWLRQGTLVFSAAGLLAHTFYLVNRSRQHDLPPLLGSPHDWLLVAAWLVVVLYLGIQLWHRSLSLGIFYLPLVLLLVGASHYVSNHPTPRVGDVYWWSMLHATLLVFGILGILLALLVSIMYLVQHRRLKTKKSELPALHLFSLERLSRVNWWLVIVSVPLVTLGMLSGLWMIYLSRSAPQPVRFDDIAVIANGAIWTIMAFLFGWLLAAKRPTGREVAWRTTLACLFLLVTLLLLKFMSADGIHGGSV